MKFLAAIFLFILSWQALADLWDVTHMAKVGEKDTMFVERGLKYNDYRVVLKKGPYDGQVIPTVSMEETEDHIKLESTFGKIVVFISKDSVASHIVVPKGGQRPLRRIKSGFYRVIGRAHLNKSFIFDLEEYTDYLQNTSYRAIYKNFKGEGKAYNLAVVLNDDEKIVLKTPEKCAVDIEVTLHKNVEDGWYARYNDSELKLETMFIL